MLVCGEWDVSLFANIMLACALGLHFSGDKSEYHAAVTDAITSLIAVAVERLGVLVKRW